VKRLDVDKWLFCSGKRLFIEKKGGGWWVGGRSEQLRLLSFSEDWT
jgi:hypothetical protein